MSAIRTPATPVTEAASCPLYRLLSAERQSLDAALERLASGTAPHYQPLSPRLRAAAMVQQDICRRRAYGNRLRANAPSRIEEAISPLPTDEQGNILEALAACRAGCDLIR